MRACSRTSSPASQLCPGTSAGLASSCTPPPSPSAQLCLVVGRIELDAHGIGRPIHAERPNSLRKREEQLDHPDPVQFHPLTSLHERTFNNMRSEVVAWHRSYATDGPTAAVSNLITRVTHLALGRSATSGSRTCPTPASPAGHSSERPRPGATRRALLPTAAGLSESISDPWIEQENPQDCPRPGRCPCAPPRPHSHARSTRHSAKDRATCHESPW